MSPKKKGKTKKAQLKESLKTTLELVLHCYPEIRKMLKKDLTVDEMAKDIMSSLEEFTPEAMKDVTTGRAKIGKRIKKLAKKLKL